MNDSTRRPESGQPGSKDGEHVPLESLEAYLPRLSRLSGLDLRSYRRPYLQQHLALVLRRAGASDLPSYLRSIERRSDASLCLRESLTVNVSSFFRDGERFRAALDAHLPALLARAPSLRLWSAGCGAGAELYSLALCLVAIVGEGGLMSHRLLGTDVNERALDCARRGAYSTKDVHNVPREVLRRFFRPAPGGVQVSPILRAATSFERHDLLRDAVTFGWDLIACRNVAIYFVEAAQECLYQRLSDALAPGGLLVLGSAEHLLRPERLHLRRLAANLYQRVSTSPC